MNRTPLIELIAIVLMVLSLTTASSYADVSTLSQEEHPAYSTDNTLSELSLSINIPVNKLKEILGLSAETSIDVSLNALNIGVEDIENAKNEFDKQIWKYSGNIVMVGMLVIFCSLALTGFFIGHLRVFISDSSTLKKIDKKIPIPVLSLKKPEDIKYKDIIAAITTLHLHLNDAEESNQMIIAWSREPVSVWKTSGKFLMPNTSQEIQRGKNIVKPKIFMPTIKGE